jgi:hypothetical protein
MAFIVNKTLQTSFEAAVIGVGAAFDDLEDTNPWTEGTVSSSLLIFSTLAVDWDASLFAMFNTVWMEGDECLEMSTRARVDNSGDLERLEMSRRSFKALGLAAECLEMSAGVRVDDSAEKHLEMSAPQACIDNSAAESLEMPHKVDNLRYPAVKPLTTRQLVVPA